MYLKLEMHIIITCRILEIHNSFIEFDDYLKTALSFQSTVCFSIFDWNLLCYLFKRCHLVLLMEDCVHTNMDGGRFAWMCE